MKKLRAALALTAVLAVTACGGGSPSGEEGGGGSPGAGGELTPVNVGVIPIVDVAPIYLGEKEGFFEEAGLDLELTQAQGGGAVSITYTTQVEVSLSAQQATVYFANPSKSNQDIVLQIVVQDVVIAQSGTLSPGKQTEKLDLLPDAAAQLTPGGYNGNFVVLYYQPDTHEKTIVNTEIPVNITVVQ